MKILDFASLILTVALCTHYIIHYKISISKYKIYEIEICMVQIKAKQSLAPFCGEHLSDQFIAEYNQNAYD